MDVRLISRFGPLSNSQTTNKSSGAKQPNPTSDIEEPKKFGKEKELTQREKQDVARLQTVDRMVRAHEQAHRAAGGSLAGAASYSYRTGPDGKRYAVAGEVPIDVSKEKDPDRTIAKMTRVVAAALAPADPSPADRAIAREASSQKTEAMAEKQKEVKEEAAEAAQGEESSPTQKATLPPTATSAASANPRSPSNPHATSADQAKAGSIDLFV